MKTIIIFVALFCIGAYFIIPTELNKVNEVEDHYVLKVVRSGKVQHMHVSPQIYEDMLLIASEGPLYTGGDTISYTPDSKQITKIKQATLIKSITINDAYIEICIQLTFWVVILITIFYIYGRFKKDDDLSDYPEGMGE